MEKSAAKENEQILEKPEPQEVASSGANTRRNEEAVENRLRECVQRYDNLEEAVQFTRLCQATTFARKNSIGWIYKTIHDANDGFDGGASACKEHTLPREDPNSRISAMFLGQTTTGPVLQVYFSRCLDVSGIEIQIPSTTVDGSKSRVVPSTGNNRYVEEPRLNDPDHNPRSSELVNHRGMKRPIAMQREAGSAKMVPSSNIEETHAKQFEIQSNLVNDHCEETIPTEERKLYEILACRNFKRNTFEFAVSKVVMKLEGYYDPDERETDGAVHWKSLGPKLRFAFRKGGGCDFSDSDWLQHIYKGSNKTRFQHCKNSQDVRLYSRAVQGHIGGNVIAPELMGHVAVPFRWKEFLFHGGCSSRSGLMAGGRESEEGRQAVFFTPLNPFGSNPDEEEPSNDSLRPRKEHYHSKWKPHQDAVYWINLARAQGKGLQFWQTRSHAIIIHDSVPAGLHRNSGVPERRQNLI